MSIHQILGAAVTFRTASCRWEAQGISVVRFSPAGGVLARQHAQLRSRFGGNRNLRECADDLQKTLRASLPVVGGGPGATGAAHRLSTDGVSITRALWAVLVLSAFWLYHFRTAAVDRTTVGESGTSATLRRWYAYGLLLLGLAFLLFGARNLLQQIWVLLFDRGQVIAPGGLVPTALATIRRRLRAGDIAPSDRPRGRSPTRPGGPLAR